MNTMEKKLSFMLALFLVMICWYFAHQKIQENIHTSVQRTPVAVKAPSMHGKWGDSSADGSVYLYLFIVESNNKLKGWYIAKDPTTGSKEQIASLNDDTPGFEGTVSGNLAVVKFNDPRFASYPANLELNGDSLTWTILQQAGKETKERLPLSFILQRGVELETDYWAHHVHKAAKH